MRSKSLRELLKQAASITIDWDMPVTGLCMDSRKVKSGDLFFAVPGFKDDGAKYIEGAFASGAVAALAEDVSLVPASLHAKCVVVPGMRVLMAKVAAAFFDSPSRECLSFGITGTKGKTSTSFLLDAILRAAEHKTALLGTVLCRHPLREMPSTHTTLESMEIQSFLREAMEAKVTASVIEVSSHALSLDRVGQVSFDGVLFTNLSPDHLDFYSDMEAYFQAKLRLFTDFSSAKPGGQLIGLANADDSYGMRVLKEARIPMMSFGIKTGDYRINAQASSSKGISGHLLFPGGERAEFYSHLVGPFNIANILGAAALAHVKGISIEAIVKGLDSLAGVPGRLEKVPSQGDFEVFVDFAHTDQSLEHVLKTLKPLCRRKLIVVFGAGGDRDPFRRTMGAVAARIADVAWITSDNPRTEDPQKIIDTIVGFFEKERSQQVSHKAQMHVQLDRRTAIEDAIKSAQPGDVICIAGKGHQTGHIVGDVVYPFDDRIEARRVLASLKT